MELYYFDVKINGSVYLQRRVISNLVSILHGCVAGLEHSPVGISFPYWQKHAVKAKASIGDVVRFSGEQAELLVLSRNTGLGTLAEDEAISIGKIQKIPSDTAFVAFRRDRAFEKYLKHDKSKIKYHLPYIEMKSSSNKQKYRLYIDMDAKANNYSSMQYTAFGFSKEGSVVPFF